MNFLLRRPCQGVLESRHQANKIGFAHGEKIFIGVFHIAVHAHLPRHKICPPSQRLLAQSRVQGKEIEARMGLKAAIGAPH